jgi:5-methylcytosine-specific restriction endonuclease McrA
MSSSKTKNSHQKRLLKEKLAKGRTRVTCCFCRKHLPLSIATLEHKIPLALGGDWAIDNLALSCADCNSDRGIANFELYQKWRRGRINNKPETLLIHNSETDLQS